jgi:hypothetical protein
MKYILETHNKVRHMLDEDQRKAIQEAIYDGDKFVEFNGCTIPLQIIPTIIPFDKWYHAENMKLGQFGKRLCKMCLMPMEKNSGCPCWKGNGGAEQNAFTPKELPQNVLESLKAISESKSFPKVEAIEAPTVDVGYVEVSS